MTNPVLLVSGAGMISVGIFAVAHWARKTRVSAAPFVFGAAFWTAAIAPKLVLDLGLGRPLNSWLTSTFEPATAFVLLSLYLGVRTGALESGFSYVAFLKTRLRSATFNEAAAFGVGFGATEAILLGFSSLLSILTFILNPALVDQVPEPQRALLLQNLNAPSIIVFPPIIERAFTLMLHLFASVLVYAAVTKNDLRYFGLSFLSRAGADALVPSLARFLSENWMSPLALYQAEIPVVVIGTLCLVGTIYVRRRLT